MKKKLIKNNLTNALSRRSFLRLGGMTAGGLLVMRVGMPAFAQEATAEPMPLTDMRTALSSPIEVEILNEFYADMRREAELPENQLSFTVVDAGGDAIKQFGDIEAMVAQEYDGIFFLVLTPEGMDDLVARAVEQGIYVFNHSASPITGCTQNVVLDQHSSGYAVGEFAAKWINEKHGGVAEVGIMGNRADPLLQERTQGLKDGLMENAPDAVIVGEVEANTIELGSAGTANLLQANPDIKVILSFGDDAGYGAYTAATEAGKDDPDEFFIGSADGTQLVMDEIAKGGIYQATWSYLFPFSATQFMRDMIVCLRGGEVPPTRMQKGLLVTAENLDEVREIALNPQAEDYQHLYEDLSVMEYSDEPLTTPESVES